MFTRSQAKIQQKVKENESVNQLCNDITEYMDGAEGYFCCLTCKVAHVNAMYAYLLTDKTKKVLLLPSFSKFRVTLLQNVYQLRGDIWTLMGWTPCRGLLTIISKATIPPEFSEHGELLLKLKKMEEFLKENGTTLPLPAVASASASASTITAASASSTTAVASASASSTASASTSTMPAKRIIVKVLPRRSARLMAKVASVISL